MTGRPHLHIAGIPVRIEPVFWLVVVFLGLNLPTLSLVVAWVAIVSVSILVHEMGHALAFRRFGVEPSIVLWGLGGLTIGAWRERDPRKQIIVSLAGPLTGIVVLGLPAVWLQGAIEAPQPFWADVLALAVFFNIFWSLVNLLPVLPLDGGNVARDLLVLREVGDADRKARVLSIFVAGGAGLYALFELRSTFMALLAGLLVFSNASQLSRGGRAQHIAGRGPNAAAGRLEGRRASDDEPASLLVRGYRSLDRNLIDEAESAADRLLEARLRPDLRRAAIELKAWVLLRRRQDRKARELVGGIPSRMLDPHLQAALASTSSGTGLRADAIADAFISAPEGPGKVQAAGFVADRGMTDVVADHLLAQGPQGTERAIRLEDLLQRLGRLEAADVVRRRLLGGTGASDS